MQLHIFTTVKINQLNTYNKENLFNRRVPAIKLRRHSEKDMPQCTTKQDFPAIIFSHPTLLTVECSLEYFLFITRA